MSKFAYLLFLSCVVVTVSSISFEKDVTLTAQEKRALDKFKFLVIPRIPKSSYIQNYIKDDLYFIHWLRAKGLHVLSAEEMFLNHLKWREVKGVDNINDNSFDWEKFDKKYPVFFNKTIDKEGRPLGELWYGDWNFRQAVIDGTSEQILRSSARFFEMMNRRLYKARAEGEKVSQTVIIEDMGGFSMRKHACPSCMSLYPGIITLLDNNYPYLFDTVFMVNVPPAFEMLMNMFRPILSESFSNAIRTFSNKNLWLLALDEKIDKSQRSVRFGGTIVRDRE